MKLALGDCRDPAGESIAAAKFSSKKLQSAVFRILRENVLCSMATVGRQRRAHINTAYFCYSDELSLYFLSHPQSQHSQNLARNPLVAVAVFSSAQQWAGPDRGLQLFGTCSEVKGGELAKAERLYGKRFRTYAKWKSSRGANRVARAYRFYRVLVEELKILDERTFGDAVFVRAMVERTRGSR